ncbi:MAG: PH domain-containing protein [Candidatus Kapaibacteriota bacterium]|jgi:membrane protein YdbS with pleckstrin-like domain
MQLNPQVKYVWIINYMRKVIFFSILFLIFDLLLLNDFLNNEIIRNEFEYLDFKIPSLILPFLYFSISSVFYIFIALFGYQFWEFEIKENEIELKRGIFTKVITTVPFNRVQHIDLRQSFIERWFDLSSLYIFTAGTKGSDLAIPGLPKYYSENIKDYLKNYIKDDIV